VKKTREKSRTSEETKLGEPTSEGTGSADALWAVDGRSSGREKPEMARRVFWRHECASEGVTAEKGPLPPLARERGSPTRSVEGEAERGNEPVLL
jgi:hypothetical protein